MTSLSLPAVSVIITNFNYAQFLAAAIESALGQSYGAVETIVVDDGSTDSSREIMTGYGKRITALYQKNGKQGAALNRGFEASSGDIILFLDADDYLFPDAAERIVTIWNPELAKVHFRLSVVDGAGESLGYSFPQGAEPLARGEVWRTLLSTGSYQRTPMSGNALSRRAIEAIFPIPEAYKTTADDYLCILAPFQGHVAAIDEPLGAYRIHGSNQWALSAVSGARFRRFVNHDLQNFELLVQTATTLGYEIPADLNVRAIGRVWSRIASLKLDPAQHPIESDSLCRLTTTGLRSLWKYSAFNWKKRLVFSVWLIWVGLTPVTWAKPAITWLYAPHLRPSFISRWVQRFKALAA